MSWLCASGDQNIGASGSASIHPMNVQGWFPFGLTGLFPCSPKESQESSPGWQFKSISSLALSPYGPTLISIHDNWKNHNWLYRLLSAKWCLCFLIHCQGLSWHFFQGASIFEFHGFHHSLQWFWIPRKSVTVSICSPSICHKMIGLNAMTLVFWMSRFKPVFLLSFFTLSRDSLVPLCFLPNCEEYLWFIFSIYIFEYFIL